LLYKCDIEPLPLLNITNKYSNPRLGLQIPNLLTPILDKIPSLLFQLLEIGPALGVTRVPRDISRRPEPCFQQPALIVTGFKYIQVFGQELGELVDCNYYDFEDHEQ
jgi:hypothetical protein